MRKVMLLSLQMGPNNKSDWQHTLKLQGGDSFVYIGELGSTTSMMDPSVARMLHAYKLSKKDVNE
jgi:hypothetical protein